MRVLLPVVPLTLRACFCAAVSALTLACSGDSAPSTPTASPTAAVLAQLAATSPPAASPAPASAATTPAEPTREPATPAPALPATNAPALSATPKPSVRPAPVTLQVTLDTQGQTYNPHQIHGNFDDTVAVTIKGSDERHSFTVPVLGIDQVIEKDRTVTLTFSLPLALGGPSAEGTFPFYCRFHGSPTSGMHGFLIFH